MNHKPIHIHKNIVDRKRNIILLFLPMVIFTLFLGIMFTAYHSKESSRSNNEATLGEKENIDNQVNFDAQ